jgi:hypothetical protein
MANYFKFLTSSLDQAEYREEVEVGVERTRPFDIGLSVLNVGVSGQLALRGDYVVVYPLEKGVVRGGREAQLENYRGLTAPAVTEGVYNRINAVATDIRQKAESLHQTVQKVTGSGGASGEATVTAPRSELKTTTATDSAAADMLPAPFRAIAGPVAPAPYDPAAAAGPADKPHYGLGGFRTMTPFDRPLDAPATVTLGYEDTELAPGIDETTVALYRWNAERLDWDLIPGSLDTVANTVTATVTQLGTFTLAPRMPAGAITWTAAGGTLTSEPILTNDGQVAAGVLVHVALDTAGAVITTPDLDSGQDGVQVLTDANGRITLQIQVPPGATSVAVLAFSDLGTASCDTVVDLVP